MDEVCSYFYSFMVLDKDFCFTSFSISNCKVLFDLSEEYLIQGMLSGFSWKNTE